VGKRILVVDDEKELVDTVADYLRQAGYRPIKAYDGKSALAAFQEKVPALVILDLGLPDMDGFDLAKEIRRKSQVPFIMLTARSQEIDRIVGLEIGADDYITKPFSPRELILRVQAVLRRLEGAAGMEEPLKVGALMIDLASREAWLGKKRLDLTPTEFDLLLFLARQPNRVFTRMQLLEEVQGYTTAALIRNIDNHVMNLRRKIEEDPTHPRLLKTVYGVGYKLIAGKE
jgi:DNA-binding response OmpR family regulator